MIKLSCTLLTGTIITQFFMNLFYTESNTQLFSQYDIVKKNLLSLSNFESKQSYLMDCSHASDMLINFEICSKVTPL